jgi:dipeptide/tripeptide permease
LIRRRPPAPPPPPPVLPRPPADKKEKESFFNWFYLAINMGSLIACTVIVYIQDSISWTLGFTIPGLAMFCAIIFFLAGSRWGHLATRQRAACWAGGGSCP